MKRSWIILMTILTISCHRIANDDAQYYIKQSLILLERGDLKESYSIATEGINKHPKSSELRKIRGQIWLIKENYNKAKAEFYEAIRLNQFDMEAVYFKSFSLFMLKKYDQALTDIEYCLGAYPNETEFLQLKALILIAKESE